MVFSKSLINSFVPLLELRGFSLYQLSQLIIKSELFMEELVQASLGPSAYEESVETEQRLKTFLRIFRRYF